MMTTTKIDIEAYKEMVKTIPKPEPVESFSFDKEIQGFYKPKGAWAVFNRAQDFELTALFRQPEPDAPVLVVTGKVFQIRGHTVAIEILVVQKEESVLRWTHAGTLERL